MGARFFDPLIAQRIASRSLGFVLSRLEIAARLAGCGEHVMSGLAAAFEAQSAAAVAEGDVVRNVVVRASIAPWQRRVKAVG